MNAKPPSHQEVLDAYQMRIEELQKRFTLYFMGIEKRAPVEDREKLSKEIRRARTEASRWSTGDRFRMNQLHQRFATYDRMWQRTLKEIEDGTYRRDLAKAKRRTAEPDQLEEPPGTSPDADGEAPRAPTTAPPAAARRAPPPASNDDALSEERVRRLYNVYMQAKKRTGEATNLTVESLRAQLAKQVPAIKAKHNCASVDFKVVMKDGKAMLKAVPK